MKKKIVIASMALMLSTPVFADTIGVYLGGNVWSNSVSGDLGESKGQIDPGLSDETQNSFFIAIEHPFPLIPNIKVSSHDLKTDGSTILGSDFEFGGETYSEGAELDTNFDTSYVDYTLYYELFDNGLFSFDFGLTARDFKSHTTVSNTDDSEEEPITVSSRVNVDEIVPILYVATNVGLPFTGFNLYANGNFLSLDSNTIYDYEAGISYELIDTLAIDVNLTLGYKAVKLELEDMEDLYSDLKFDGVYAGAVIHF